MEVLRPGTVYYSFNRAFILRSLGDAKGAMAAAVEATHRAPGIEYVWMRRGLKCLLIPSIENPPFIDKDELLPFQNPTA